MRFVHCFCNRIICEVSVSDEPPTKGTKHTLEFNWSKFPKLTPRIAREYVAWVCSINRILADKWQLRFMHAVEVGPDIWEFWSFAPGEDPKLLSKDELSL